MADRAFDFVCIGSATQDVFVSCDTAKLLTLSDIRDERRLLCFDYGGKVGVEHIEFTTGGGATNTAVSLARLGARIAFIGKVGTDPVARLVLEELAQAGVDTSRHLTSDDESTGYSVILTSFEGDRTVLVYRGANESMTLDAVDLPVIDRTRWLYVTSLSGESAGLLGPLAERASAAGVKIAFNPGSTQLRAGLDALRPALEATTVLLVNKEEAAQLTGKEPVKDVIIQSRCTLCGDCIEVCPAGVFSRHHNRILAAPHLCSRCGRCVPACPADAIAMEPWSFNVAEAFDVLYQAGPDVVVITDGERGVQAYDGQTLYALPARDVPVASSLGAGDAFGSAFAFEYARSGDIGRALALGVANSARVVQTIGAKNGLLTADQAERELAEFDESAVRRYPFADVLDSAK